MNKFQNKHKFIITNKIATMLVALVAILFSLTTFYFIKKVNNGVFGGRIDWLSQHVVFIDFLRQNFWNTGEIFPDFTLLLGGGINFADLSYYGVMRPEVLISYLFPFIPSYTWVVISYFAMYILSGVLCYRWLSAKTGNWKTSFIVSVIYLASSVLFIHSIMNIMFTNYLSWIFLLLIGIDKYDKNSKYKYVIILATMLLICSSYYFAVGGLIIVGLYTLLDYKRGFKSISSRICYMFIGVLLSGFFLAPTIIETLLNSRERNGVSVDIGSLFIPTLSFKHILLYISFDSPTLTMIVVVAIIYNLLQKDSYIRNLSLLVICLVSFELFMYIFSGLDYVYSKTLIPLLPILLLLIVYFINNLNSITKLLVAITSVLLIILIYYRTNQYFISMIIDVILVLILGVITCITNKKIISSYVIIPVLFLFATLNNLVPNIGLSAGEKEKVFSQETKDVIKTVIDQDDSLSNYRFESDVYDNVYYDSRMYQADFYSSVVNRNYVDFLYNQVNIASDSVTHCMQLDNDPFALYLMGVNKIVTYANLSGLLNYNLEYANNGISIFKNDVVLPISYVSYDNISSNQYESLSQASQMDALVNYGIVEDGEDTYNSRLQPYTPSYQIVSKSNNLQFDIQDNGAVVVNAAEEGSVSIKLDQPISEDILMIDLELSDIYHPEYNPVIMSINGYTNMRRSDTDAYANGDNTFAWHLGSNGKISQLDITFSKGTYTLTNITTNLVHKQILNNRVNSITPLTIKDNHNAILSGEVECLEDGYLLTSIPYQEGFKITVDGKEQSVELVNSGFIGTKLSKGTHKVEITYEKLGEKIGNIMSITAIIIIFVLILRDVTNKRSKDKS